MLQTKRSQGGAEITHQNPVEPTLPNTNRISALKKFYTQHTIPTASSRINSNWLDAAQER
jgi:hypothetical protein